MKKLARFLAWLCAAVAAIFLAVQLSYLARIWWWVDHNPSGSAFMEARLDQLRTHDPKAKLNHQWIPYDRISMNLKRAIVVAEDSRFVDHEGFDWDAIEKAREKNKARGKVVAGGSTISQQLAKNLFLSASRTPWRKGQEAIITVMIEHLMDKRRILEIYLNVIEWGEGVFGAQAAAQHYFRTTATALTAEQSARLAAIVPNPRFYDRNRNTPWIVKKTGIILARMPAAEVP